MKSVLVNHQPKTIFIHTDQNELFGEFWNRLNKTNIKLLKAKKPESIFGKKISKIQHAADIARIRILMKFGGIYLDNDAVVIQKLDKFLKYEMTVAWPKGQRHIEIQCLIAHRDARFLKLWYKSYENYNASLWVFNSGVVPAQEIIKPNPALVHLVSDEFMVQHDESKYLLYHKRIPEKEWRRKYYVFHLNKRWQTMQFNEQNIRTYNEGCFGDMARAVLP
ncbi:uncharacterized protein B4U80_01758 [Leptotrombidium deliense]|uniref:Alpha-1,4-N-acetylglucosaminyltransferase n=1 Tax=Leptotrombidium deliense TaxID=299467 RepID=A0A443S2D7_9ACAR|nr:uncharacterized protein B4U80_01758 [Leptotrombidium deliense]